MFALFYYSYTSIPFLMIHLSNCNETEDFTFKGTKAYPLSQNKPQKSMLLLFSFFPRNDFIYLKPCSKIFVNCRWLFLTLPSSAVFKGNVLRDVELSTFCY